MRIYKVLGLVTILSLVVTAGTASAQGYGTDARKIAMGGNAGDSANIAMGMVDKASPYTVIVIPLGLIQVFQGGLDKFNPTSDKFDPVRAAELASSPLHYTFGRSATNSGQQTFMHDLVNKNLNTNLATYVGFKIPTSLAAQGLASPAGGGTIKFAKSKSGAFQGIYIGVGPYFSYDTALTVDQKLADLLGLGTACLSCAMPVTDSSHLQLAMSTTIGYRGRIAINKSATEKTRDAVYLAYNYHILKGFKYLAPDIALRVDTTATGGLTINPVNPTLPFNIVDLEANSGKGHASDIGVEVVHGYFEVGFGLNGMGNQIEWTDFTQKTITLNTLAPSPGQPPQGFTTTCVGSHCSTPSTLALAPLVVKLPVVKTGNIAFHNSQVGAMMSYTQGYNGKSFHGGVEKSIGPLWLRGGGKYTRGKWDPTYGFGIGDKTALDFGFYGTHANLEGKRQTGMAISLRFTHKDKAAPTATKK
jgi:hypothetical protein